MSDDALETRKLAANWREYLADSRESLRVFAWVWTDLIGPRSKTLCWKMILMNFVATLFSLGQALPLTWVINGVINRDVSRSLYGLGGFIGCMLASQFFQHHLMVYREHMIGENVTCRDHRITELFFAKSLGQHMRDGSMLSTGSMEKGKAKANHIQEMLLFNGIPALLDILVVYVLIWSISPVAGLVMSLIAALQLTSALHLSQRCVKICTPIEVEFSRLNRQRLERWDKIERVKTNGQAQAELESMTVWSRRLDVQGLDFWLWFIRMINWRGLVHKVLVCAVMAYGVWRAWHGAWSIGLLYPLFSWCLMFIGNLWRVEVIERELNWSMPSVKNMMLALTMAPDIVDKPDAVELAPDSVPRVEFRSVGHTYADATLEKETPRKSQDRVRPVLNNVEFAIEPGEKVALIGSSGAGKTTIMRLLLRYMDPDKGEIFVAGRDLRDYRLSSWTDAIAYIAQQPQVMDGTIRSNLLYGLSADAQAKVTDEDLWAMMRRLQIDFGDRLTDGLDTRVGRNGIKLSGGEAQRLMIGAAAMRQPRFMIIDEATSSLDSTTEKAVQRGLAEILTDGVSALIIAHRLSSVRHLCTKFAVLKNSEELINGEAQIEAMASSFEELHALSPTFRRLCADQEIALAQNRPAPSHLLSVPLPEQN
ncbi:MAG: ABC transporter ATP-binding protein [Patescibacteria group bacterium]